MSSRNCYVKQKKPNIKGHTLYEFIWIYFLKQPEYVLENS